MEQQIYPVFHPILSPSQLTPIRPQPGTLSVRIHLCPLTVAAVTLNAAVCQEACSVTFMVMARKTEDIMCVCVGVDVCAHYGPEVGRNDESGCLFAGWTLPEGRAKGEKDKIAVLDEREGKLQDLATQREKLYGGDLRI